MPRRGRASRSILDELVGELPSLRRPIVDDACRLTGPVARRMWHACAPHRASFVTPMAAVAGAVADELIAFYRRPGVWRASVNDGGDIALHLAAGASLRVGLFADLARVSRAGPLALDGRFTIDAASPVRGVATSGWRGRSFSFGIADSVTVLARDAATADAAATMIANAVDIDDPGIVRRPASALKDDTDLGDRLVTVEVPHLDARRVHAALDAGRRRARGLQARGLIDACVLVCQGATMTCEPIAAPRGATAEVAA